MSQLSLQNLVVEITVASHMHALVEYEVAQPPKKKRKKQKKGSAADWGSKSGMGGGWYKGRRKLLARSAAYKLAKRAPVVEVGTVCRQQNSWALTPQLCIPCKGSMTWLLLER